MEMIEWALQQPPNNPKGEFYYSNLGCSTAGGIPERAFNETYEDWSVEHLSDLLVLETFDYGPQDAEGNNEQSVSHHQTDGVWAIWENHESTPSEELPWGAHGSLE